MRLEDLTRNVVHALAATVLFAILTVALLVLGDHQVRSLALVALMAVVFAQFLAQADVPFFQGVALVLSYFGGMMAFVSMLAFMLNG